jgi:hypothetical protein
MNEFFLFIILLVLIAAMVALIFLILFGEVSKEDKGSLTCLKMNEKTKLTKSESDLIEKFHSIFSEQEIEQFKKLDIKLRKKL